MAQPEIHAVDQRLFSCHDQAMLVLATRVIAFTAISMFAAAAFVASPATAAPADACGLLSQAAIAKAFGLAHATKSSAVIAPPGNTAGVVQDRCRALVWSGDRPTNVTQRKTMLADGTLASLEIKTWVTDSGPYAGTWQGHFKEKLSTLRSRSRAFFIRVLHGTSFAPLDFGVEHAVGYQGARNRTREVQGFWWNTSTDDIASIKVVEAKGKPTVAALDRIAAKVVPAFR